MNLNVIKSSSMLLGSRQRIANKSLDVSVGGTSLPQVNSVRYLGIIIDNTLSWSLHISSVVSRVRSHVASLIRYGSLPPAVLCLLYTAFVLPLFDYCDVVWCPTTAKLTAMIEKVHSKFVKSLPPSNRLSFTLTERRRYHTAKSIRKSSPSYLQGIFEYSKDVTGHVGRNTGIHRIFVPRVFNNCGKRSFYYRGSVLWNNLSSAVVEAASLSLFKRLYFQ